MSDSRSAQCQTVQLQQGFVSVEQDIYSTKGWTGSIISVHSDSKAFFSAPQDRVRRGHRTDPHSAVSEINKAQPALEETTSVGIVTAQPALWGDYFMP